VRYGKMGPSVRWDLRYASRSLPNLTRHRLRLCRGRPGYIGHYTVAGRKEGLCVD
jgi:hypothetical protein